MNRKYSYGSKEQSIFWDFVRKNFSTDDVPKSQSLNGILSSSETSSVNLTSSIYFFHISVLLCYK